MYDDYEQNTGDYKLFTDFLSLCKYNLHFSQNNFELIPEKKKIILKLIDNNKITILENYNSIGSFFSLLELYSIQFPLLKGNLSNKQSGGKKIFKYYKTTPKNNRNTRKIQGKQAISNKNNKNL